RARRRRGRDHRRVRSFRLRTGSLSRAFSFRRYRLRAAAAREAAPRPARLGRRALTIPSACAGRALAPFALRGVRKGLREVRGKEKKERRPQGHADRTMEKNELDELRDRVSCAAVLEKAGFAIDLKESTRKA